MAMGEDKTLTSHSLFQPPGAVDPRRPAAQLVVALCCDRPLGPSSRHIIEGVDAVLIGRGPALSSRRDIVGGERQVILQLPDQRMSGEHARVFRARGGGWALADAGSKNGTGLNGAAVKQAVLADGDVIELGHTLVIFRDEAPAVLPDDPDLVSDELRPPAPGLATFSAELAEQWSVLERVAPSTVSAVILGETGTGKEVAARALHAMSRRRGAFVGLNCGAIAKNLIESELFGHQKGAYSGALADRPGVVRAADRGTLFLDEIGELPLESQVAFLRVLQEQEVVPVGGEKPVKVDVRLCVATHVDLDARVKEGSFREDLYARLSGLTVRLPPLCERREDLGLLVGALLRRGAATEDTRLTPAAARHLLAYEWPRNVRELEKCLHTAHALAAGQPIDAAHLPEPVRAARLGTPVPSTLDADETAHRAELDSLLVEHEGNIAAVARAMGKARNQIHRWAKRYGLRLEAYRRP